MEEEISPTIPLHRFIAVAKTDDQVEQLRLAILQGGEYDLNEIDQRGYSSLHWAGIGWLIQYDSYCTIQVSESLLFL